MSEARRLFLSASDLSAGCRIARIAHPRTAQPFAVALAGGQHLLEVQKCQESPVENPRSWLLTGGIERVQQEGALFIATPLDPLFLLLPPLRSLRGGAAEIRRESSAGLFRPLSDLASEAGDEEAVAALEATALAMPDVLARLRAVCDVNDKYDEPMLRLNDAKLAAWLRRKVNALKAHLATDAAATSLAARKVADTHTSQFDADAFEPAAAPSAVDDHLAIAVALVADYLEPQMQETLCSVCGVDAALVSAQRGPEKKGAAAPPPPIAAGSSGSSWATEIADADAEVTATAATGVKREGGAMASAAAPAAKKLKPAPPAKSKAASVPLKKGQSNLMGFFGKPK